MARAGVEGCQGWAGAEACEGSWGLLGMVGGLPGPEETVEFFRTDVSVRRKFDPGRDTEFWKQENSVNTPASQEM